MKSLFRRNLFFCLLFLGVGFPLDTQAEGESGVSVTPVFQEVTLQEGEGEENFSVKLRNNTENSYTLRLSVLDFGTLDETGGVAFLGAPSDLEKKYALASWMRPETDTLTLDRGQSKEIRVSIENRESLSPGGHYGALVFRVGAPGEDEHKETKVSINQLFSVLVFAKKIGGEVYHLELQEKEALKSLFSFPTEVRLRFKNMGNVHVIPRGVTIVTDPLKREVGRATINEESSIILPESLRVYSTEITKTAKLLLPGYYTLRVDYRYDGKEDFTQETLSFWYIPPVCILLFCLFFLCAVIVYQRKRHLPSA